MKSQISQKFKRVATVLINNEHVDQIENPNHR